MRHGRKINHLSRKSAHRKAMLSNMACSLIEHKRIATTVAKAKALKVYVEPLMTKSKTDSTHSRRVVFSHLKSKDAVSELFREVAPKIAERNGGYTRIIKTGPRQGDNAEMCIIELVDFNELYVNERKTKSKKRRSRRGGKGKSSDESTPQQQHTEAQAEAPAEEAKQEETQAVKTEETAEAKTEKPAESEEPNAEAKTEVAPEDKAEEKKEEKKPADEESKDDQKEDGEEPKSE